MPGSHWPPRELYEAYSEDGNEVQPGLDPTIENELLRGF